MKYILKKQDGITEEVNLERWAWGVIYKNGEQFHQFDKQGFFHQVGEIKQEEVRVFSMYKIGPNSNRVDIVMPEGAKIIHKYRNSRFNVGTKAEKFVKVYEFGYKIGGFKHFNYILPNDIIIQTNRTLTLEEVGIKA